MRRQNRAGVATVEMNGSPGEQLFGHVQSNIAMGRIPGNIVQFVRIIVKVEQQ